MPYLTAQEARNLMPQYNLDLVMETIMAQIRAAAERDERSIQFRGADFGSSDLYMGKPNVLQQIIIDTLKDLGYIAAVRAEQKQFVDIYLNIAW